MAKFVCTRCVRIVRDPRDQFVERHEFRRLDGLERRLLFTVRDLCRDCVDGIRWEREHPDNSEEVSLFDDELIPEDERL